MKWFDIPLTNKNKHSFNPEPAIKILLFTLVLIILLLSYYQPFSKKTVIPNADLERRILGNKNVEPENTPEFISQITCSSGDSVDIVFPTDLDGDNQVDIIYGVRDLGHLLWYKQEGNLSFIKDTIDLEADGINYIDVYDLDQDGDKDIVASLSDTNQVVWYERKNSNQNDATFEKHIIDSDANNPSSILVTDLNGDDTLDIIATSYNNGDVYWYKFKNNTDPKFPKKSINNNGLFGFEHAQVADFDNNGFKDIVAISLERNSLIIYGNNENETFNPITIDSVITKPTSVEIADLNGDNILDIVVSSQQGCLWYKGNSTGFSFEKQPTIDASLRKALFVQVLDLNQDNRLDLIVGSDVGISWYKNKLVDDAITFERTPLSNPEPQLSGVESVFAIDLDNDNDLDIVASSKVDGKVAWFINGASELTGIKGENQICGDSVYTYSSPKVPGFEYEWGLVGGEIIDTTQNQIQVRWNNINERHITLRTTTACASPKSYRLDIINPPFPRPNIQGLDTVCQGERLRYHTTSNNNQFQWYIEGGRILSGQNTSEIEVIWDNIQDAKLAIYEAFNSDCFANDTLQVIVLPPLENVNLSTENDRSFLCLGGSLEIKAKANTGALNYRWFRDQEELVEADSALIEINKGGTYKVIVQDRCGNEESDEIKIKMINIETPNIFTPNSDGLNDRFLLHPTDLDDIISINITIADRFGNIVFQGNDKYQLAEFGWDGGRHPSGVYICTLRANLIGCGSISNVTKIKLER